MNKQVFTVGALSFSLFLVGCSTSQEAPSPDTSPSSSIASSTTSTQSEEERKEELRQKLEAAVPVNQVDSGNLVNKCIMAIHEEIPNAGDYDFSTPVDLGDPDAAGIYSDGGSFRYESSDGTWEDATYFCTVYTENDAITDSSAVVID